MSGRSRMMYQNLELEPEGAICPKRSKPQALHSSPHDTLPVSITGRNRTYKAMRHYAAPAGLRDRGMEILPPHPA
jgi:hypothetical protein